MPLNRPPPSSTFDAGFTNALTLLDGVGYEGNATIDGLKSGYVTATLDQLLYLQGFMPVLQCVLTAKYKMPGLAINTGAGTVTPETIDSLVELIDSGIR